MSLEEAADALRVLRHGGVDEATTGFRLPPAVRAAVSPIIAAMRWGGVLFGMVFATPDASDGDLAMVATLTVVLFFTSWRTFRPIHLASNRTLDRTLSMTDVVIVAVASGWSGGPVSPFALCVLVAVLVAAFGWGAQHGVLAIVAAIVGMAGSAWVTGADPELGSQQALTVLAATAGIVVVTVALRSRLLEAERRRQLLAGRIDRLTEANDLLAVLNRVARTLPTALDHKEALNAARDQLHETFGPTAISLVARTHHDVWVPQLSEAIALPTQMHDSDLPDVLTRASEADGAILVTELNGAGLASDSHCGLYTRLEARGETVGLLAIEHAHAEQWSDRDRRILDGLADVLGLTIDNARWFQRLRNLGAEQERGRIARDLHDRLGQWLTYISLELERINTDEHDAEIESLHADVQTAIDELRQTLRQLRTSVTDEQPFEKTAAALLEEFSNRRGVDVELRVTNPGERLPLMVEQEMFRILQEGLNNVDRHAEAEAIDVVWSVNGAVADLTLSDDGKGFDTTNAVRQDAYGLVGMRERAEAIGADLDITSAPGDGTTIAVSVDLTGSLQ